MAELADMQEQARDDILGQRPAQPLDRPWSLAGLIARFNALSLAGKLRAAVLGNAALMLIVASAIVGSMALVNLQGQTQTALRTAEARVASATIAIAEAEFVLERFVDHGDRAAIAAALKKLREARRGLGISDNSLSTDTLPEVRVRIEAFDERLEEAISLVEGLAIQSAPQASRTVDVAVNSLRVDLSSYHAEIEAMSARSAKRLIENAQFIVGLGISLALIAIAISLLGSRTVMRNLVDIIAQITEAMRRISQGEAETPIPGEQRGDELGEMARALAKFRQDSLELRDLHGERAKAAELALQVQRQQRRERTAFLESMAAQFEVSVGQVITAVVDASSQLRETSTSMVAMAEQSASQSQDATKAMERTASNVSAASLATDEFAHSIAEISSQAAASARLARQAGEIVDAAHDKMAALSSAAEEVGEIVELIRSIAQRTNLLALNASIEAARGGEAGRGFAIVAAEVKELANQTSNAASTVSDRISAMQSSTVSSVDDLTSIVRQIEDLERAAVTIATAVDQQSLSGEDLARNIESAANGSAAVATQLENLQQVAHATGAASNEVLVSAETLDLQGDALDAAAKTFLTHLRGPSHEAAKGNNKTGAQAKAA